MSLTKSPISIIFRHYWPLLILIISVAVCSWIYFSTSYKQEQFLMSREWQSTTISRIEPTDFGKIGILSKVYQHSNMVYLPNHTYSRITRMELYSSTSQPLTLHFSEKGHWDVSGGYLLIHPVEIKDITTGNISSYTVKQLNTIKKIFKMNEQESRRIDIINEKSLLLTSLTYGSNILYSD